MGDRALFYHSNVGLECVGVMEIVRTAAQDSTDPTGKWRAVLVSPVARLRQPVTIKTIKADPALAAMEQIRQSRLSVAPERDAE